ncbi:MAG: methylated-DNA--[Lentisphaeria bacterium]|nr:methylated-DNA--[protein]-cysteine S-methyltransferase [Lentisphaeria bacterium]
MIFEVQYDSPVGPLTVASDGEVLIGLRFAPSTRETGTVPVLTEACRWLDGYFSGNAPSPRILPLAPAATAFQALVREILLDIPFGRSMTYGEVARLAARRLGKARMSAQAVGNAVGANPLPVIVPCHRVLASGGRLGGFSSGPDLKRRLLELEHIPVVLP